MSIDNFHYKNTEVKTMTGGKIVSKFSIKNGK